MPHHLFQCFDFFHRVEYIVGKCCLSAFSPFPTRFQKDGWLVGYCAGKIYLEFNSLPDKFPALMTVRKKPFENMMGRGNKKAKMTLEHSSEFLRGQ